MTQGEVTSIATVIGSLLTLLGITGVDAGTISGAVNGVIAVITLVAAISTFVSHRNAVKTIETTQ